MKNKEELELEYPQPRRENFDMQMSAAFDELQAYRDTGLDPQQVRNSERALELVAGILDKKIKELADLQKEVISLAQESVEREKKLAKLEAEVAHWAELAREGKVVVLPCVPI